MLEIDFIYYQLISGGKRRAILSPAPLFPDQIRRPTSHTQT